MPFGFHLGGKKNQPPQQNPYVLFGDPPTASDGPDLYIHKVLAQAGVTGYQNPYDQPGNDFFSPANGGQKKQQRRSNFLNSAVKYASIAFAGLMGLLGIRAFMNRGAAGQAAKTVKDAATQAALK